MINLNINQIFPISKKGDYAETLATIGMNSHLLNEVNKNGYYSMPKFKYTLCWNLSIMVLPNWLTSVL